MGTADPFLDIPEDPDSSVEISNKTKPGNGSAPAPFLKSFWLHWKRKGFYLYLPPLQAILFLFGYLLLIQIWQSATRFQAEAALFYTVMIFSILSPVVNIFFTRWWRNSGLYILSLVGWALIMDRLLESVFDRPGEGLGGASLAFLIPFLAPFVLLPISGVMKLVVDTVKKSSQKVIQEDG